MTSVNHTHQLIASNGVFITEFDCTVECTVLNCPISGPYLRRIDAILVTQWKDGKLLVADLLDSESGQQSIGEEIYCQLWMDKGFRERAVAEFLSEREHDYAEAH